MTQILYTAYTVTGRSPSAITSEEDERDREGDSKSVGEGAAREKDRKLSNRALRGGEKRGQDGEKN